jgi:hypothetical protein
LKVGLQEVGSVVAARCQGLKQGRGHPRQDVGTIGAGAVVQFHLQALCEVRQAFTAHHLTGDLEAANRIQGAGKVTGGKGQAQPFDPVGKAFDEALDNCFPDAFIILEIRAEPVQHGPVEEGQDGAIGVIHDFPRITSAKQNLINAPSRT